MVWIRSSLLWCVACAVLLAVDWQHELTPEIAAPGERPLVIMLSTPGCTFCARMLAEAETDPGLEALYGKLDAVHLDARFHPHLVSRFAVQAYPTLVLINQKREWVRSITGYLPPDELAVALQVLLLHGEEEGREPARLAPGERIAAALDAGDDAALLQLLGRGSPSERLLLRRTMIHWEDERLAALAPELGRLLDDELLAVRSDAAWLLAQWRPDTRPIDPLAATATRRNEIRRWRRELGIAGAAGDAHVP